MPISDLLKPKTTLEGIVVGATFIGILGAVVGAGGGSVISGRNRKRDRMMVYGMAVGGLVGGVVGYENQKAAAAVASTSPASSGATTLGATAAQQLNAPANPTDPGGAQFPLPPMNG